MTDPLTLLRDADPAARAPDAGPPRDVLERIVATPPPRRRRRAPRRLVVAAAAGAVAIAAVLGVIAPGERTDLAARAYAATAPGEDVLYTELYGEEATPWNPVQRSVTRIWQRGDQSHRVRTQSREGGRSQVYEYVLDDGVLRGRMPDGEIQSVRESEGREARGVLETERRSFVDSFRARYADAELRDAGPTTFDGRPAHAYEVIARAANHETYYLDPENGMPMGFVISLPVSDPERPGQLTGEVRITEVVKRIERLPATPESLARLTAPWATAQPR